ncbi:hypothetical protein DFH09DRAFT_1331297 [Mycena vulgaris]|nr:hypothetical protein DFH09DRAFT_1331297 [Mycena vulgaris]
MVRALLFPCFTPSSASLSRDSDIAGMRESTWLGAGVMPSGVCCLRALGTATGFCLSSPAPPPPPASHPGSIHTDPRQTLHPETILLAQRGAEWRRTQLARRLDDQDDDTDDARPVPADDSTPPPPTRKRKSPDLHEEAIRTRLWTRCPAEVYIPVPLPRPPASGTLRILRHNILATSQTTSPASEHWLEQVLQRASGSGVDRLEEALQREQQRRRLHPWSIRAHQQHRLKQPLYLELEQ